LTGHCETCGEHHPVAGVTRRLDEGRLVVTCPVCRTGSVVDYLGTRPLPECGHTVEIVNRVAAPVTGTQKARKRSRCPTCQKPITPGQQIARLGREWVHTDCTPAVAAVRRPVRADEDDRHPVP
jgi:RNase P subunit RPR2